MPIRLACSTSCALALTAEGWASPSAHVPAGRYELAAWHERVGENVTAIEPAGTARVTFVLPIDVR